VGKTVVASSLAVALARSGVRCVAVDADFGAANLHTLLGVPEPRWVLRHFLGGEVRDLGEIACATSVPNLRLISGARAPVYAANLGHPQRQKLLRHLRRLDADDVILDLGAGSSFNALDFFVSAHLNLVVVTPESTAIENAYHFIKAAWFRVMRPAALRPEVRETLRLVLGARRNQKSLPPRELLDVVSQVDVHAGSQLRRLTEAFRPALVMNRVTSSAERALADHVAQGCRDGLRANVRSVGGLRQDKAVPRAVDRGHPVLERFPDSRFADDIYLMAELVLLPPQAVRTERRRSATDQVQRAFGLRQRPVEKQRQIRHLAALASAS
jgi:flagellar biosynthesis protein FlhG